MLAPVFCPVAFNVSSRWDALSDPRPKADRAFCALSIVPTTSVWFTSANLMKSLESDCSSCPVAWKRVFVSPTALPIVSKSVGIVVAISSTMPRIDSNSAPVAPVFRWTMSIPASTSLKDLIARAPTPTIGAVTFFVMVVPTLVIFSPTAWTFSPTSLNCCAPTEPNSFD